MKRHFNVLLKILIVITFLGTGFASFSEGTKELQPAASDYGFLQIYDLNTRTRPFATYDTPEEYRLNIRICNLGEKIYFGLHQSDNDVYYRLKDPNGNVVMGPSPIPRTGQQGFIPNHSAAVSGPSQVTGTGYYALEHTPTMTGDYYIEFNPRSPTAITPEKRVFNFVDFTVADESGPSPVIKKGRLHSKNWDIQCMSDQNPFKAEMFVYAKDSIVTALNFNNIMGFGFTVSANSRGCTITDDPIADRQSRYGNETFPEYMIFLNNPDEECFPSGDFGEITAPTTITGCDPVNRCINVYVSKPGAIDITLDLNGIPGYQPNSADVLFQVDVVAGHNCIKWNSRDGLGNLVPPGTAMEVIIDYFNGMTHLPLYDVEHHRDGYIVNLVRPFPPSGVVKPKLYWDDSRLDPRRGQALDPMVNLEGCELNGCHKWQNRGENGPFMETINTWWYANVIRDEARYVVREITVDANANTPLGAPNDTTVCVSTLPMNLNGQVIGATGGIWSFGKGTFSSLTDLQGTYTPSEEEIAANLATIVLTSTGNDGCPPVSDTMKIFIQPLPLVDPGEPFNVCVNNPVFSLTASVENAEGLRWSGGQGRLFPNPTALSITYEPSANELNQGFVTLYVESTGNGLCAADKKDITITFTPAPVIDAGEPIEVCANAPEINLNGQIEGAEGGRWLGGNGTFIPGRDILETVYIPSQAEINAGGLRLYLESTGNGSCLGVSDTLTISFIEGPVANAGPDLKVCANTSVDLAGAIAGASGGIWSGGEGTFMPDRRDLKASYIPSANENIPGNTIILTLTSTSSENCPNDADELIITIGEGPSANAGPNQFICDNNPIANLSGTISLATGGVWSGGNGSFIPNRNSLNVRYTPTQSEIQAGAIPLLFTTTGNDTCAAAVDTVIILISSSPVIDAGQNQVICANNAEIQLNASASNATDYLWSGGQGVFIPNAGTLNPKYIPSQSEIQNGYLRLKFQATQTSCKAVEDYLEIHFTQAPQAHTGPPVTVCENKPEAFVYSYVIMATGGVWSGGQGRYSPSNTSSHITYTPTEAEVNNGSVTLMLTTTGNGNCLEDKDSVKISFIPGPIVNAGPDQEICYNNPVINLSGSISGSGRGYWSGGQGGYFSPGNHLMNTSYIPSQHELNSGLISLYLTSTDNGNCNPVTDTIHIRILPIPSIEAGPDKVMCATGEPVSLSVNLSGASGVVWSGGQGVFNPENGLTTRYTPSITEISNGIVTLTATSTGNGPCKPVSDKVNVRIIQGPSVNAGPDQLICGAETNFLLSRGSYSDSDGIQWSTTGNGTFSPSNTIISPRYNITKEDKENGSVSIIIKSVGNPLCPETSDTMQVSFTPVPSIDAGPDRTVCTNALPVNLYAVGTPAVWTGGQGRFSPSRDIMNPEYHPSPSELSAGSVTLTSTTIPTGSCPAVSDQVIIRFEEGPSVSLGPDLLLCGNASSVNLTADYTNTDGVVWSSSGSGAFIPDKEQPQTTYAFSSNDKLVETIYFFANTSGSASCPGNKDTLKLTLTPEVKVDAGPDQTFCADIERINLAGNASNAGATTWSSLGSGQIQNRSDLITTYTPSVSDRNDGKVTLVLTSSASQECPPVSDTVVFSFTPAPTIYAGPDRIICKTADSVHLNGQMTIATEAAWRTNGTGSFSPSHVGTNVQYYLSPQDRELSSIQFILQTTSQGNCQPVSDTLLIRLQPEAIVEAGGRIELCETNTSVLLNGSVSNASGVLWSTSGSGSFGDPNRAKTTYQPGIQDYADGSVVLTMESADANQTCQAQKDFVEVVFIKAPTLEINPTQHICINEAEISVSASSEGSSSITWTSNGNGTFNNTQNNLYATYYFSPSDQSLPEIVFEASITGYADCPDISKTTKALFTPLPEPNAGPDITVCADTASIQLNANANNSSGGVWSTNGTGVFFPNKIVPNPEYTLSVQDIREGDVRFIYTAFSDGPCPAVSDTMNIIIVPATISTAGADIVVCASQTEIPLNGTIAYANTGIWSSSGSGHFSPSADALNARYIPSAADTNAKRVILTLSATGNDLCKVHSDQLEINFTSAPQVKLGPDITLCETATSIPLQASVVNAGGGRWSYSGTGSLSPDITHAQPAYLISEADRARGQIDFIYASTNNGLCPEHRDTMTVFLSPLPKVEAGPDMSVCYDETGAPLSATYSNSPGIEWLTDGSGEFAPDKYTPSATYVPSVNDKNNGLVNIRIVSLSDGICPSSEDQLHLTITPAPFVNAGPDQLVCEDSEGIKLNGVIERAGGGVWISSGSGAFSPNAQALDAVYYQSKSDIEAGVVTLTLVTTDNGNCFSVRDSMLIRFDPLPKLDLGPDLFICEDVVSFPLQAVVENASGVFWQLLEGDGQFNPSTTQLLTNYEPSSDDKTRNYVTFMATATGTGKCNAPSDDIRITFSPLPTVNAGPDKEICVTDLPLSLEGSGTYGQWSGGNGTYSPSNTTLQARYYPTAAEIAAGTLVLQLESLDHGTCPPTQSSVVFTIIQGPDISASAPTEICASENSVNLSATLLNASDMTWSSSGSGSFANSQQPNTIYTLSERDKMAGTITFTARTIQDNLCAPVSIQVQTLVHSAPLVDAGFDLAGCVDRNSYSFNASVQNATTLQWAGGTGSFSSATSASTIYTPSNSDKSHGVVTLYIEARGNPLCPPVRDSIKIRFVTPPSLSIDNPDPLCTDQEYAELRSTISGAQGGIWTTSGSGIFSPNPTSLNPRYYLSLADKTQSQMFFTLTSTGNNACGPVTANTSFTLIPAPLISVSNTPPGICEDHTEFILETSIQNASGVKWTSGHHGLFIPDESSLKPAYRPSQQEINQGAISLTVTTTGSDAACQPASHAIVIPVNPSPTAQVNAGQDQELCVDIEEVSLNGQITVAKTAVWSTSGDGIFTPSNTYLSAQYIPGPADRAHGSVFIGLTTTDNGICDPASDTMRVTFTPTPSVDLGPDDTVCVETFEIALTGTVDIAMGGRWSANGSGYFTPAATSLSTVYIPSEADKKKNELVFTLTTTGNGTCKPASMDQVVTLIAAPKLQIEPLAEICATENSIQLNVSISGASNAIWTSNGTGSFDNTNGLSPVYNLSADDQRRNDLNFIATTTGNAYCQARQDQAKLTLIPVPELFITSSGSVCSDMNLIELEGYSEDMTLSTSWTSSGTGNFFPNPNQLNTNYIPSEDDRQNDSILFQLTLGGDHVCKNTFIEKKIYITPAPIVSTAPISACDYAMGVSLSGTVQNAGGGRWSSSGTGAFSPSEYMLATSYYPSEVDAEKQNIQLYFISTDNGICGADTARAELPLAPPPIANAGPDQRICVNTPIMLSGNMDPLYSFQWKSATGHVLSNEYMVKISANENTFYTYTVMDPYGCQNTDTLRVTVLSPPSLHLDPHYCFMRDLVLDSKPQSSSPMIGDFHWMKNSNLIPNEKSPLLWITDKGSYMVVYSDGNCSVKDLSEITAPPALRISGKMVCAGDLTTIQTIGTSSLSYTWMNQSGGILNSGPSSIDYLVPNDTTTLIVMGRDSQGCTTKDSAFIIGTPRPILSLSDSAVCQGEEVIFLSTPKNWSLIKKYTPEFNWHYNNQLVSQTDSMTAVEAGEYIAMVQIGECITRDTARLTHNPNPEAGLDKEKRYCEEIDKYITIGSRSNGLSYLWTPTGDTTQSIVVQESGMYYLTVSNEFDCIDKDSILVRDICPPRVFAPTAITVNGDSHNDYFEIYGKYFTSFTLTIFNRWGEIIYYSEDASKAWDGYYRGEPMPIGVYPWIITYEGVHEDYKGPYMIEGKVSVIR